MTYIEELRDLFTVDEKYYLAQCVSACCSMSAGIAVEFQRRFNLRPQVSKVLQEHYLQTKEILNCVQVDNVYNLITKLRSWEKPTYDSLRSSLMCMRYFIVKDNIKHLAIPKIGCGIDGLDWCKVKHLIQEVFSDVDVEILVCFIDTNDFNVYSEEGKDGC